MVSILEVASPKVTVPHLADQILAPKTNLDPPRSTSKSWEPKLVGGFKPFEKYARQIGNQVPK